MTLAASAVLALAACGGDGGDGGPGPTAGTGSTSTQASSTTSQGTTSPSTSSQGTSSTSSSKAKAKAKSSTTSSSSKPTDTGKPFDAQEFTGKLTKAVDANPTVSIDVTATINGQQGVTATGVQDLADDALDMQVDMGGQKLGYRLVDGQYYLAQPPKWVPVTQDSTNPLIKQTLEQVQLLSMRKQLDAFVAGVEKAGDKGPEEIDGVPTRHYTATVDTAKAYKQLGMTKDPGAPDSLIYDVWLDDDDLIRQMTFTQDDATATLSAKNWGDPVSIVKPKDSELAKVS